MPLPDALFTEAERQLNVCNACRYCEGYCAVFPALERRRGLNKEDIMHLSNLCHDCRDCLYACPYAAPHEFALNPPKLFSEIRVHTYDEYAPGGIWWSRAWLSGPKSVIISFGILLAALLVLVLATHGIDALWTEHARPTSPYSILPYLIILFLALIPAIWSIGATTRAGTRYWHQIRRTGALSVSLNDIFAALYFALELRYLRGGGQGCSYGEEDSSSTRRIAHHLVFYGFLSCLASTIFAGILQDGLGAQPPYSLVSGPVILGTLGGIALVSGCVGLIFQKVRSDSALSTPAMYSRDYGLLVALLVLAITGLLSLTLRTTRGYGIAYVIHLAVVLTCFAVMPYTKFVHFVYRVLSIVKDNLDTRMANTDRVTKDG